MTWEESHDLPVLHYFVGRIVGVCYSRVICTWVYMSDRFRLEWEEKDTFSFDSESLKFTN